MNYEYPFWTYDYCLMSYCGRESNYVFCEKSEGRLRCVSSKCPFCGGVAVDCDVDAFEDVPMIEERFE
jgi:hypothetical protein